MTTAAGTPGRRLRLRGEAQERRRERPEAGPGSGLPGTLTEAGQLAGELLRYQQPGSPDPFLAASRTGEAETAPHTDDTRAGPTRGQKRKAQRLLDVGRSHLKSSRHAEALAALGEAASLDPTDPQVLHEYGHACIAWGQCGAALAALGKAVALQPGNARAQLDLGRALDATGRAPLAIRAYRKAVELEPALTDALVRLGELALRWGERNEAETAFRAATVALGNTDGGRISAARAALLAGRYEDAEQLLRAVLFRNPINAWAHAVLGGLLADTGRLAEASASYERAATLDPSLSTAWYGCALSRRFTPLDRPLIARMEAAIERRNLPPDHRTALCFALGKAHDDLGEYGTAMQYFDAGNRIDAANCRLDRSGLANRVTKLIAASPAGFLSYRPDFADQSETPILIVGMPRSGTTLVEQILSSHPAVAAGGELTYWADLHRGPLGENEPVAYARQISANYLAGLRGISSAALRVTDKLPLNYENLGLIRQLLPRALIVHCRRHPVDTCLSIYVTSFGSRLADRGDLVFLYRQYERLMAHWRAVLPEERFIELDYETLVADPEPTTRRLIACCALDWNDACLSPHRNRRAVTTASLWQARQPIYERAVGRWRHYEPWLGELRELLPPADIAAPGMEEAS
ncbi:MAG: tetratricopeptide repeat-containing sulfotransferase family protein [Acetobacteraceae bacterium]